MSKSTNVFLTNIANLTPEQAKKVWALGHEANIITEAVPAEPTGKALREAVGDVATVTKLARMLSGTPGQEGVVQALYGRPARTSSTTAKLPAAPKKVAANRGRPATGNASGRYSNETIPNSHYVIVKVKNPKRAGTASFARFAKYKNGATVAAICAIEGGPRMDDLRWDLQRGYIEVVAELPKAEGAETKKESPKTKPGKHGITLAASA